MRISVKAIAVILAAAALQGCKTTSALLDTGPRQEVYQTIGTPTLIETAKAHSVEPLEPNFYTDFLDTLTITENGNKVGINVREYAQSRADEQRKLVAGANPIALADAAVRGDIVRLKGPGADRISRYGAQIVARLLKEWPYEQPFPAVSVVVCDDEGFNARMTRFNVLYLSVGLLVNVESEDELAGVIAHELAHSLLNHHAAQERQAFRDKQSAAMMMTVASLVANKHQNAAFAILMAEQAFRKNQDEVGLPKWLREQEVMADILAVDLTKRAGYDWGAVSIFLKRLKSQEAEAASGDVLEGQGKPSLGAAVSGMVNQLDTGIAALITGEDADAENDPPKYDVAATGDDHPTASERLYNVSSYEHDHYKDVFLSDLSTRHLRQVVWQGAGYSTIKRSAYLMKAEKKLEEKDYAGAVADVMRVLNGARDPDPRARMILYNARMGQGNTDSALLNLEIARTGREPPPIIFEKLANGYTRLSRWDKAIDVIKDGQRRGWKHPTHKYYAMLIGMNLRAGHDKEAMRLVNECGAKGAQYRNFCEEVYIQSQRTDKATRGERLGS